MWGNQKREDERPGQESTLPDMGPIEPRGAKPSKASYFRWLVFAVVIIYMLLTAYRVPVLMHIGKYLILEHTPQKSDLIVCLSGGNIERGLGAAESFQKGLAPKIFLAREELPDGVELLKRRGVEYPETIDLMVGLLQRLGAPRSAILTSEKPVGSTFEEAGLVKELVGKNHYQSLIIITSPTHSRRAWLTFTKVFDDQNIRIQSLPTPYSGFRPEDWWKKRKYIREVILEYQKLTYYALKYLW